MTGKGTAAKRTGAKRTDANGIGAELGAWFGGRLPEGWFEGPPSVSTDRDEIQVIGLIPDVAVEGGGGEAALEAARTGRIKRFREETRGARMHIAAEAEHAFGKKVSWGAQCGSLRAIFTHLSLPVMTRLRMPERLVLDTLVDAGVARSRSDALGWCVRLVAANQTTWIEDLRAALIDVEKVRSEGPTA